MVTKKKTGRASSMCRGLAFGGCVSLVMTIVGSAALAKMIETEMIQQNSIGYGVMVLLVAASFLGAAVALNKIKRRKVLVCVSSGGIYMGILLCITALFFGGQYSAVGVTAIMVLCGTGLALLTGAPRSGKKRGGRARIYSR